MSADPAEPPFGTRPLLPHSEPDCAASSDKTLRGARCLACGQVLFPAGGYGCTFCGAGGSMLEEIALSGRGRLEGAITVYQPLAAGIAPPFIVARVRLEEGPEVEAILKGCDEASAPVGMLVRARGAERRHEGGVRVECCFVPVPA